LITDFPVLIKEYCAVRDAHWRSVLRLIEMRIGEIWTWAHALVRRVPRPVLPEQVARGGSISGK
jgi:hypothetical protein